MSPRDSFWFLAGVLVAVAVMVTVRAWLRDRPALGESTAGGGSKKPAIPSFAVPVAAGLALIGVALGVYFLLGFPESAAPARGSATSAAAQPSRQPGTDQQPSSTAGSLDRVTNKLAVRLATQGGSDKDWELLAQSYEYMGKAAEAKAARAHQAAVDPEASGAQQAAGTPIVPGTGVSPGQQASGDQIADLADAFDEPRVMTAATAAAGVPERNGKGSQATSPETDAGSPTASAGSPSSKAGSLATKRTSPASAEITGTVDISSNLASRAKPGATLFIYAKQLNVPGPPLAVLRVRADRWPVHFTLNDGNAMVTGRKLSNANSVQIEARISKSGDALPQRGDLVGTVTNVNPRDGHPVKISIDAEIG